MAVTSQPVQVQLTGSDIISGDLNLPATTKGLVLFAHGSGSSRHSKRNQFVASQLNQAGFGTLLVDLLTTKEDSVDQFTRQFRFDIALLAERLTIAIDWLRQNSDTKHLPLGLFGASTGSAAAIIAAAEKPQLISAVVSRGGRADLAGRHLPLLKAPTLFIVGGADDAVIDLNRQAIEQLRCSYKLEIVPGATHLFEEPGTLECVAHLAAGWFLQYLAPPTHLSTSAVPSRRP